MSLDIRFKDMKPVLCPHCGEPVKYDIAHCAVSSGRGWYPVLEYLGYYDPNKKHITDDDWYGKDMMLTPEQVDWVFGYIVNGDYLYNESVVSGLLACATMVGNSVAVNADW